MRERQPEATAEAVRHADDRGPEYDEIYQVQRYAMTLRTSRRDYLVVRFGVLRFRGAVEHVFGSAIAGVAA